NKFVTAYKEAYGGDNNRPINVRSFFMLFYTYFICAGIILAASPIINMIEELLADVQTQLMAQIPPPKDIDGEALFAQVEEKFQQNIEDDSMFVAAL
ncbi:hypothetical protein C3L57_08870, partial [Veillonellaceae bacterium M2-8]|nr:hypothetical protein [Veillonellaceae bacterium M2-8]